jgi:hypothetical protein
MKKKYIFHSTCYDKELLRKQSLVLNDNKIDYRVVVNEGRAQARAPLSGFFEAEIHVYENDFEKADKLLKELIEKYS